MAEKYTEAQKKASLRYAKDRLKRVPLDLKRDDYEKLSESAKAAGKSINGFIKEAIREKIEREKR
ncbi:ribbon-helix-helix protein, CopG family [Lachnospiraceae bacterium 38-14]|jgi:predicted HicB family RNase H-like nuclease|uniref:ribbon-helix-helix protein, CopG family n=1 Tax=Roseburia sp. 1XD42-69 TaxID=2320088 RepID=UPI000EA18400|nr:ribbon-helix-helix protein, CopG family [Roseburia sp. 1XD42-69]RKJ64827.1 ribbon-helix-helix protein, CopG family [Roseburia sp. 1XD42-69]